MGWDSYKFEKARKVLSYSTNDRPICHANSCSHDEFRGLHAQPDHFVLNYTHIYCHYCKPFHHDANSYPYHINDAHYANFEKMTNDMTKKKDL